MRLCAAPDCAAGCAHGNFFFPLHAGSIARKYPRTRSHSPLAVALLRMSSLKVMLDCLLASETQVEASRRSPFADLAYSSLGSGPTNKIACKSDQSSASYISGAAVSHELAKFLRSPNRGDFSSEV